MDIYSHLPTAVPHKPHPTQAIVCAATLGCSQCDNPPRTNSNNEHGICLNGASRQKVRARPLDLKASAISFAGVGGVAVFGPRGPFAKHHSTEPVGMDLSF